MHSVTPRLQKIKMFWDWYFWLWLTIVHSLQKLIKYCYCQYLKSIVTFTISMQPVLQSIVISLPSGTSLWIVLPILVGSTCWEHSKKIFLKIKFLAWTDVQTSGGRRCWSNWTWCWSCRKVFFIFWSTWRFLFCCWFSTFFNFAYSTVPFLWFQRTNTSINKCVAIKKFLKILLEVDPQHFMRTIQVNIPEQITSLSWAGLMAITKSL